MTYQECLQSTTRSMWRIRVRIAKNVRTIARHQCRNISPTRFVAVGCRRKRQTTLQRHDAGKLPTAKYLALQIALVLEERQLINVVAGENVATIQSSETTIQPDVVGILRSRAAIRLVVRDVLGPRIRDVELRRIL